MSAHTPGHTVTCNKQGQPSSYCTCGHDERLIAAAPELAEACALFTKAAHDAVRALNEAGIACPSSIAFAAEKARAALAKAGL